MEPSVSYLLQSLPSAAPWVIVSLVGLVLALVNLNRASTPAVLVLIGSIVLLAIAVALPLVQAVLLQERKSSDMKMETYAEMMAAISIGASWLRALAVGLVLAAVFVGRRTVPNNMD